MKRICGLVFAVAMMLAAPSARAEAGVAGELHWAGDATGGAPYVFADPANPGNYIGFEKDLVEAIAKRMNRKAVFEQQEFKNLPESIRQKKYDIAICGIEISEENKEKVYFGIPYYATAEQITVKYGSTGPVSLDGMVGKRVATLTGALSETILKKYNLNHRKPADKTDPIEIVGYEAQDPAYQDLIGGRVDAVLMDAPIALYSADPKRVSHVGEPLGAMQYGIAVNLEDKKMQEDIDAALEAVIRSGEARKIYEKWGLWNEQTKELFRSRFADSPDAYQGLVQAAGPNLDEYRKRVYAPLSLSERLGIYFRIYLPLLLSEGVPATLEISVLGMLLAIVLGMTLAVTNVYGPLPLRWLARGYIEMIRGTPLLIQLYLIYWGLPRLGIEMTAFPAAVIGLGLNYAAYEAENYRAGLLAVPRGQMEAALALGMHRGQALWHVIVPQALRITIPPVTNDFVALLKDSSIVSTIGMMELTKKTDQLAHISNDWIGIGLMAALVYFVIGLPFVQLARFAERKLAVDKRSGVASRGLARRWLGGAKG